MAGTIVTTEGPPADETPQTPQNDAGVPEDPMSLISWSGTPATPESSYRDPSKKTSRSWRATFS